MRLGKGDTALPLALTARCPPPPCVANVLADELIRQITINCGERGLLLLRVRDEIRMTIAAYQTLYESSIAFGMRKALMAEQRKAEMEAKVRILRVAELVLRGSPQAVVSDVSASCRGAQIKHLQAEIEDLQRQVEELTRKCQAIEEREVSGSISRSLRVPYSLQADLS